MNAGEGIAGQAHPSSTRSTVAGYTMKLCEFLTAILVISIAGCSGESSSPSSPPTGAAPPPPPPPVSTSITSTGVITGFGSVVVNGVHNEVDNSTVVAIEGKPETTGDDSQLRLGMRVNIEATETNGVRTAERIEFDDDLRGPAENVTPDANNPSIGTFTVIGQDVTVDANTVFDDDIGDNDGVAGIDIRDLDPVNFPGNAPIVVEVSGFPMEDGVLATRIDRVNAAAGDIGKPGVDGDEFEVKGFVDSVASDGSSFVINGATFLVSGTIFENGLAADQNLVGVFVEVKADVNSSGDFVAVRVELEDNLGGAKGDDEFEVEGVLESVDTVADPDVIVINGVTIEVSDASDLVVLVGHHVEIKGSFDSNGVLVINETEIEVENTIRTLDRVANVSTATGSFTTRLGLEITPTEASLVQDIAGVDGDRLTPEEFLSRLMDNDHIEARGFPDNGSVTWTRIARDDRNDQDCRLRGPVDAGSISDPRFSILGVTIDTTGLGFNGFEDTDDTAIGRTDFFNKLQDGDVVEARSDSAGTGCSDSALSTGTDGEVSFEADDDVAGNEPPAAGGPVNDNQISGTIRNLDPVNNTFEIGGQTITVTANTLFDASIVKRAGGTPAGNADTRFGDLSFTLDQLLSDGDSVTVEVDGSGNAVRIEDND